MRASRVGAAGLAYFGVVFAAGFALGTVRVLWLLPRVGERTAELIEAPLMLAVTVMAARWLVLRFGLAGGGERLAAGLLALTLLVAAELSLVLGMRGVTLAEYAGGRDPVSGMVYLLLLALYGLMPGLVRIR